MREPAYFVLASLLDGPLYGYAIIQRTGELSDGGSGWRPGRCTRRWTALLTRARWRWWAKRSSTAGCGAPTG